MKILHHTCLIVFIIIIVILILTLLPSCSREIYTKYQELPRCRGIGDVEHLSGGRVFIEGTYEQEYLPSSKRLQPALIVLPDGTPLIRSYRPVASEFRFIGKRVIVIGTVHKDAGLPSNVQQVMAPHVYPELVRLAPGEKPTPVKEGKMPPLPFIETDEDAKRHEGKWVHVHGTLLSLEKRHEGPFGGAGIILLSDGTKISSPELSFVRANACLGSSITLTTRIFKNRENGGAWTTSMPNEICPGRAPYCGIKDTPRRETR